MTGLSKEQWGRIISIVLLAVAAIFSVLGFGVDLGIINFEPEARAVRERIAIDSRFDSYLYNGADLYVYSDDHVTSKFFVDGATGNTTVAGTLTGSGTVTVSGTAALVGNVTLSALLRLSFADETITNGEVLTPTVTVYALDSSGNVTVTLAASASEGQLLILIGDDNNTVTVADTNLRSHDGAALTIGQYDSVMLVYQDSEWIQLVELANQ